MTKTNLPPSGEPAPSGDLPPSGEPPPSGDLPPSGEPARAPDATLLIDVRGPRFGASLTTAVLATAIVAQLEWLVAFQVVVFAVAALAGLRWSVYGNLFRFLKRRLDLGPPPEVEEEGPPRFAQLCGLIVAGAGLGALMAGAQTLGWILVGLVLALSSLLALTGICVGCELYLLGRRLRGRAGGRGERDGLARSEGT